MRITALILLTAFFCTNCATNHFSNTASWYNDAESLSEQSPPIGLMFAIVGFYAGLPFVLTMDVIDELTGDGGGAAVMQGLAIGLSGAAAAQNSSYSSTYSDSTYNAYQPAPAPVSYGGAQHTYGQTPQPVQAPATNMENIRQEKEARSRSKKENYSSQLDQLD